ncbi:MAG: hypothetical protein NT046_00620 [Arenimonas sp.]|nr:hypothetical protein [Arenimonas sp.]
MFLIAALMLQVATPVYVDPDDRVIQLASQLDPWCRSEAEARLAARGQATYGWTSSHMSRGNVLHVEGKLRVQGAEVAVHCRIAQGARLRYASIDLQAP